MQSYDTILFDLDGTLVDSSQGITKSVAFALNKRGYGVFAPETLKHFIGPPLREQFMAFCGVEKAEGGALVEAYREYYGVTGIFECALYDGVPEMLDAFQNAGKTLFVATSKPEKFARTVLAHFGLTDRFAYIGGACMDNTRTDKCEVIRYTLENAPHPISLTKAVMVGDSPHDILGARKAGLDGIAVSYGFGDPDALKKAEPLVICDSVKQLQQLLS